MDIAIINYGMNNLYSVQNACRNLGMNSIITDDHETIMKSKIVILPGVGAFGEAIRNIRSKNLDKTIYDFINSGKPFFGVCLGMQLLFDESEEFGSNQGLGIIKGKVSRFKSDIKKKLIVPHVGWNKVLFNNNNYINSVMKNNDNEEFMYFVHSYYVTPSSKGIELTSTIYQDTTYCSSIIMENITAFQFHPEKSGNKGIKIFNEIKKLL
tara:strand:- start:501 stop:1130 length:630 start_codon:yes stop_codon:yes gene_type:complete